jgi:hypothetical protein
MVDPVTKIETAAAGWALKNIVYIAICIGIVLLFFAFVWRFILAPMNAAHDNAVIKGQGIIDKADAAAAHGASPVIERTNNGEAGIAAKGRDHVVFITKQPGADTVVPDPLWNAFIQSVCMRDSAAGDLQCKRLREAHP